jgi:hypothetical protein
VIAEIITFVLSNFPLTFLVIGLLTAAVQVWAFQRPVAESFLAQYLLFAVGLTFLYNFVMHVFFAEMAAKFIGWANSPFQYEVGYASLGFGVVAILAHRKGFEMRLAAILGPALFLWGAAGGHIYQMVTAHNFAPGNAGVIFWADIFVPILGFVLLGLAYRRRKTP